MSDALISRRRFEEERAEQAEAVDAGRKAVAVATDRYKEGKASYYDVLEAQQQLFPAENALSRIEAGRRLAVVQLYKALGCGWSLKDSEWTGGGAQVSSSHNDGSGGRQSCSNDFSSSGIACAKNGDVTPAGEKLCEILRHVSKGSTAADLLGLPE